MFLRSSAVLVLVASIFFQQAVLTDAALTTASNTETAEVSPPGTPAACTNNCLRSMYVSLYRTPPYLTAKVKVTGTSFLRRMRGCVVYGEFTTPNGETIPGIGWVGTRDAMIRMALPTEGSASGEYTFTVKDIKMRGNTMYTFDPVGSNELTATITIP